MSSFLESMTVQPPSWVISMRLVPAPDSNFAPAGTSSCTPSLSAASQALVAGAFVAGASTFFSADAGAAPFFSAGASVLLQATQARETNATVSFRFIRSPCFLAGATSPDGGAQYASRSAAQRPETFPVFPDGPVCDFAGHGKTSPRDSHQRR
jgi:hypothetical protein